MTERNRETLKTVIALVLAQNQVPNTPVLASQITEAVIASGLTAQKDWTE